MCDIASKMKISHLVKEFDPSKMIMNIMGEFKSSSLPIYKTKALVDEITRFATLSFRKISAYDPRAVNSSPYFVVGRIFTGNSMHSIEIDCYVNALKEHLLNTEKSKKSIVAETVGCLTHELAHLAQSVNSQELFEAPYDSNDRKAYMNNPIEIDAFAASAAVERSVGESVTINSIVTSEYISESSLNLFYCRIGMWHNLLKGGEYIPLDKDL